MELPSVMSQIVRIDVIASVFCIGHPAEPGANQLRQAHNTYGFLVALARQPRALSGSVIGFPSKNVVQKI